MNALGNALDDEIDVAGRFRGHDGSIDISGFTAYLRELEEFASSGEPIELVPARLGSHTQVEEFDILGAFRRSDGMFDREGLHIYLREIEKEAYQQHHNALLNRDAIENYLSDKGIREPFEEVVTRTQLRIAPPAIYSDLGLFPSATESSTDYVHRLLTEDRFRVQPLKQELLERLAGDPKELFSMHPRAFEELVARLMERMGFKVELTKQTRDGGRDVLALKDDGLLQSLYLVECKRYAPDRIVGVDRVRSLYGVLMAERATAGIVVTTSRFTAGAVSFAGELRYQMQLKDYDDLLRWIGPARGT
ncbi:MAG: restriction endonuclease [Alphaproteobacteria bacterium]|nr:MAG: restriction endonuclease [Alphaproteobacteria bacterium]